MILERERGGGKREHFLDFCQCGRGEEGPRIDTMFSGTNMWCWMSGGLNERTMLGGEREGDIVVDFNPLSRITLTHCPRVTMLVFVL